MGQFNWQRGTMDEMTCLLAAWTCELW